MVVKENVYQIQSPYPKLNGLARNIRYARVLLSSYSGRESELTSVHQYIYHHRMAFREHPNVSACLQGIAVVEMHHLDLLGDCIYQLGLHPTYCFYQGTRRVRWNTGFVHYGRHLRDMLDTDIRGESHAIENYRHIMRQIPEKQIQELLDRIIQDEELHLKILTGLRNNI